MELSNERGAREGPAIRLIRVISLTGSYVGLKVNNPTG
jgi:hypothetical protein